MDIKKILGVTLTVGMLVACGTEGVKTSSNELVSQKSGIMNGSEVKKSSEQPTYQSTVALATMDMMAKEKSFCTGTIIHPRVILTAAHCVVDDNGDPVVDDEVFVVFGNKVTKSAPRAKILLEVPHPRFDIDQALSNEPERTPHDIALLLIDRIPSNDFHPTPVLDGEVTPYGDVIVAGYGVTANGLLNNNSGKLREVNIKVNSIDPDNKRFSASGFLKGTCSGDSGGPVYLKRDGRWVVTGVTSAGPQLLGTCLGLSLYTNASMYRGWIRRVMTSRFDLRVSNPIPTPRPNPVPRLDNVKYVECSSIDRKYETCETGINLRGAVVGVHEKHSSSDCTLGISYGPKGSKIWVDRGCRATFKIQY